MPLQKIPPDDDLDPGIPPYGPIVRGWIPFRLSIDSRHLPARIVSARGYMARGCVGKVLVTPSGDPGSGGVLFRRNAPLDLSTVELRTKIVSPPGFPLASASWTHQGVVARMQGGVGVSPTSDEGDHYLQEMTGYAFVLERVGTGQYRFRLYRSTGSLTILSQSSIITPLDAQGGFLDVVRLRMLCQDEAGDVRVRGFCAGLAYAGADLGGTSVPGGKKFTSETKVLDFLDDQAAKVTTAGRAGFIICGDVTTDGKRVNGNASLFRVRETGQSADWLFDPFSRPGKVELAAPLTDAHGRSGFDVGCQYLGDAQGIQGGQHRLKRSLTSSNVFIQNAPNFPLTTYALELRKTTQELSRARSVRIKFNTLTSRPGLLLFASPHPAAPQGLNNPPGYTLLITTGPQGIAKFEVLRVHDQSVPFFTMAKAVPLVALNVATWYKVEFSAYVLPTPDGNGPVVLSCKLDDTKVDFVSVKPSGEPVVGTMLIDGDLWDISDQRQRGPLDGLFAFTLLVGDRIDYDDWNEESLFTSDPNEEAPVAVVSELDGKFGEFTLPTCWELQRRDILAVRRTRFDSGRPEHIALATDHRRVYEFVAKYDAADYASLRSFWNSHKGGQLGFEWQPPQDTVWPIDQRGDFHFAMRSIRPIRVDKSGEGDVFHVDLKLEELLG